MATHSPGPWHLQKLPLEQDGELEHTFRISAESTLFLYVTPCSDGFVFGQNEANAHLLAAAPDLLEALIEIIALDEGPPDIWHFDEAFDKGRAAIAKATGRKEPA